MSTDDYLADKLETTKILGDCCERVLRQDVPNARITVDDCDEEGAAVSVSAWVPWDQMDSFLCRVAGEIPQKGDRVGPRQVVDSDYSQVRFKLWAGKSECRDNMALAMWRELQALELKSKGK